jgi:hypothetical protein
MEAAGELMAKFGLEQVLGKLGKAYRRREETEESKFVDCHGHPVIPEGGNPRQKKWAGYWERLPGSRNCESPFWYMYPCGEGWREIAFEADV